MLQPLNIRLLSLFHRRDMKILPLFSHHHAIFSCDLLMYSYIYICFGAGCQKNGDYIIHSVTLLSSLPIRVVVSAECSAANQFLLYDKHGSTNTVTAIKSKSPAYNISCNMPSFISFVTTSITMADNSGDKTYL